MNSSEGCDPIKETTGDVFPLSHLKPGGSGVVVSLASTRFGDHLARLGLLPGTRVFCIGRSPLGDPAAYRFLGSVFAIRARDADSVFLTEAAR